MSAARIAVVTGANRGIGRAIARQLTTAGVEVLAAAREPGAGDVTLDITRRDQIAALADRLSGGFDILVNNAAVLFDGFDAEVARRTLEVNFFGTMHLTDALLPRIRAKGSIVMVSSGMGALGNLAAKLRARFERPLERAELVELMKSFAEDVASDSHKRSGWPSNAYSVSKLGLNALTRTLARELTGDPRGIRVNSVCPGWVRTRMGGRSAPRSVEEGARTPVWLALLPADGPTGGVFRDERPIPW
jgi:carbonyl reductase 1